MILHKEQKEEECGGIDNTLNATCMYDPWYIFRTVFTVNFICGKQTVKMHGKS